MTRRSTPPILSWLGSCGILLLGLVAPVRADEPDNGRSRSHVPIRPPEGMDWNQLLMQRLYQARGAAAQGEQFRKMFDDPQLRNDFLQKMLADREMRELMERLNIQLPRGMDNFADLKPDDPNLQRLLKELSSNIRQEDREKVHQKVQEVIQQRKGANPGNGVENPPRGTAPPPTPSGGAPPGPQAGPPPSGGPGPEPIDPSERADAAKQFMDFAKRFERLSGPLSESPAFRDAIRKLSRYRPGEGGWNFDPNAPEGVDGQLARLNRYARKANSWLGTGKSLLPNWRMPAPPRINLPGGRPNLRPLPSVRPPSVSAPDVGDVAGWNTFLWVGLVVLVGLLLGKIWRRPSDSEEGAGARWKLGPWPVNPARVATRAELIRAFEYLSLLRLGLAARSWNHREIAQRLGGAEPDHGIRAVHLADLYEQARYAPGEEPLPEEALAAARRDLCFLAGVTAA